MREGWDKVDGIVKLHHRCVSISYAQFAKILSEELGSIGSGYIGEKWRNYLEHPFHYIRGRWDSDGEALWQYITDDDNWRA